MSRKLVSLIVVLFSLAESSQAQGNPGEGAVALKVQPAFETITKAHLKLGGFVGKRLQANLENWELRAPDSNPALVEMFYDRDRKPERGLLPWSGEFVGKYLCSSILSYRLLRDPRQKAMIDRITRAFINSQGADGYLGPFDGKNRLTGSNWDIWGHYWAIRALLMVHEEFQSPESLQAATRAADLLVSTFLDKGIHLTNDGSYGQMNYAVIHAFTQLYRVTGKPEYLEMARWVVKEWNLPGAGLYMRMALAGHEMFEFPGNRWESLHDFLGMYDMYLLTGDPQFRQVFTRIWYSILKGDRHNTGGFTSGEKTTGNPYDKGPIETCCTVAWIDMSIAMLKLTGDPLVADELELSTFNGNLGGQNPAGNWWTYNTPMEGTKEASAHSIHFQCRAGSPELNCCSVNGPRGIGLVAEWAVMRSQDGLVLNYYGPSTIQAPTPAGQTLQLEQKTDYPVTGNIAIQVVLAKPEKFELKLRIPSWSSTTRVSVNGQAVSGVRSGSYLCLQREWKSGDTIHLELDSSLHYWAGEREYEGRTSIYDGPILLAFDPVYNPMDPGDIPELDARNLKPRPPCEKTDRVFWPWLLVKVKAANGEDVTLCDFATAGAYGNSYRTWLPIKNVAPLAFDPSLPVWNNRPR
jgi:hypothetical protein